MNAACDIDDDDDLRESHRARIERHMDELRELTEIGMGLARTLGRRALAAAEAGDDGGPDVGLVFSRLSRAVRQTIALEARLSERLIATLDGDKPDAAAGFAAIAAGAAERLREKLRHIVEASAPRDGEPSDAEPRERLADPSEVEGDGFELGSPAVSVAAAADCPSPLAGEGGARPRSGWEDEGSRRPLPTRPDPPRRDTG